MRIVSWNMRKATRTSPAWKILIDLQPDLALLQEVSGIPRDVEQSFDIRFHNAVTESGKPQKFGTVVLVKGAIVQQLPLSSEYDWVNQELDRLKGNVVCYSGRAFCEDFDVPQPDFSAVQTAWRRERDSNPRSGFVTLSLDVSVSCR